MPKSLDTQLDMLPPLNREELVERWRQLYGVEPPVKIRDNFLIQAIAYRLQEQALGGLRSSTKRFLEKATANNNAGKPSPTTTRDIKTGMRLLREWHGVMYEVIVEDDGVILRGKRYRSLSEVAKAITGTRWSGPLFFGLKKEAA